MPAIRVAADCAVYFRLSVESLAEGQEIPAGEFADYLLATGAPVESLDTPAAGESGGDPETPPASTDTDTSGDADSTAGALVAAASGGEGGDLALIAQVPDGTKDDVLAWVNGDSERAAAALLAERARGAKARTTLVAPLTALLDT